MSLHATAPRNDLLHAHPIVNGVFLFLLLAGVSLLALFDVTAANTVTNPFTDRDSPETCVYVITYGQRCPSCGITRSLVSALHGDWERSRSFHPAGLPILLMVFTQLAMRVAFLWPRLRLPVVDGVVSLGMVVACAWLLNG